MQNEANAGEVRRFPQPPSTRSRRGMSTVLAGVLIVAILIAGGLGTYLALPAGSSVSHTTQTSTTTCEPANSTRCRSTPAIAGPDQTVMAPYGMV